MQIRSFLSKKAHLCIQFTARILSVLDDLKLEFFRRGRYGKRLKRARQNDCQPRNRKRGVRVSEVRRMRIGSQTFTAVRYVYEAHGWTVYLHRIERIPR